MEDFEYLKSIWDLPSFQSCLERNDLHSREPIVMAYTPVFDFQKHKWHIPTIRGYDKGVDVHFEIRKRGELRIDVEPLPYKPGMAKDEAARCLYEEIFPLRDDLFLNVRGQLMDSLKEQDLLGTNIKYLRNPLEDIDARTAVKFSGMFKSVFSPSDYTAFYEKAITEATPHIDRIVEEFRLRYHVR